MRSLFYQHIHPFTFVWFWANGSVSGRICTVHMTSPAAAVETCLLRTWHERSRFRILRCTRMFVQCNYLFTKPFQLFVKLKQFFQTSLQLNLFCAYWISFEVKFSLWPPLEMMWLIRKMEFRNTSYVVSVETENTSCYILAPSNNNLCEGLCWT